LGNQIFSFCDVPLSGKIPNRDLMPSGEFHGENTTRFISKPSSICILTCSASHLLREAFMTGTISSEIPACEWMTYFPATAARMSKTRSGAAPATSILDSTPSPKITRRTCGTRFGCTTITRSVTRDASTAGMVTVPFSDKTTCAINGNERNSNHEDFIATPCLE